MAQGLGHRNLAFWCFAIPSYVASAYTARIVVRLVHEEIWYRRAARRASRPRQDSNLRPAG